MRLLPDKQTFLKLADSAGRIPIVGEIPLDHFPALKFFEHLHDENKHCFLFESAKGPEDTARYTFLGQGNSRQVQIHNQQVHVRNNGTSKSYPDNLDQAWSELEFQNSLPELSYIDHFWGGWVGYIGYEMGGVFEQLPLRKKNDLGLPDLCFMQVDQLWVYDRLNQVLKYILAQPIKGDPEKHYDKTIRQIRMSWQYAQPIIETAPPRQTPTETSTANAEMQSNVTRDQYMKMVRTAKEYIKEGDIYQANLSQQFETDLTVPPLELYSRLRKVNPSPFSGYLQFGDWALVSSSPERLFRVERNLLETRPIAGTRPRGRDTVEDEQLSSELLLNEKERAEHLMLVDLERNDLGRICEYGSVQVTDLMFLEQYSHVSHIVSNIQGTLRLETRLPDILKALFPGGTITGCPKIRCMEIIDELEPSTRGPYSGSFGYIGFADYMDFNIIIRTIITKKDKAYFNVGAGIVADSIPEMEYQETLDKAAALMQVLKETPQSK